MNSYWLLVAGCSLLVAGCSLLVTGCWLLVTGCWLLVANGGCKILMVKSYRDLEIYQLSYKLAMKIHRMSLNLPKYELYEEGGQIRRSSKGVSCTIVEGALPIC